jgi:hypothetical protein
MRMALTVLLSLAVPAGAIAATRTIAGNAIVSRRDPAVTIGLPGAAHYVGTDHFLLHDPRLGAFDDCELYAFAEADRNVNVRKLYWVQFESYLPDHPQLHHTYDSPRHVRLGGMDFYLDTSITPAGSKPDPGSDDEHYYALLRAHGFRRGDMMGVRLVHLTDASKRKELMIIYREALPPDYTAADLAKGGATHDKWPALERGLIARAEHSVRIGPLSARP